MHATIFNIAFTNFPTISESIKSGEPYYWDGLELHHTYRVVSDYEKFINNKYQHFLLIINKDHKLQEIPVRDNIKVNFIS